MPQTNTSGRGAACRDGDTESDRRNVAAICIFANWRKGKGEVTNQEIMPLEIMVDARVLGDLSEETGIPIRTVQRTSELQENLVRLEFDCYVHGLLHGTAVKFWARVPFRE